VPSSQSAKLTAGVTITAVQKGMSVAAKITAVRRMSVDRTVSVCAR